MLQEVCSLSDLCQWCLITFSKQGKAAQPFPMLHLTSFELSWIEVSFYWIISGAFISDNVFSINWCLPATLGPELLVQGLKSCLQTQAHIYLHLSSAAVFPPAVAGHSSSRSKWYTKRRRFQKRSEWVIWILIGVNVKRSSVIWLQPSAGWHVLVVCKGVRWVTSGARWPLWCCCSKVDDESVLWLIINIIFLLQKM